MSTGIHFSRSCFRHSSSLFCLSKNLRKYHDESKNVSNVSNSLRGGSWHFGQLTPVWNSSTFSRGRPLSKMSVLSPISGSSRGNLSSLIVPQVLQKRTGIGHPQYLYLLTSQSLSLYSVFARHLEYPRASIKFYSSNSSTGSLMLISFDCAKAKSLFE